MKLSIVFLFLGFCFVFASCTTYCKDYDQVTLNPVTEQYFSVYKPGNYFIFKNQDGTKKDSMYVSNYTKTIDNDKLNCVEMPVISFVINSEYLSSDRMLNVEYRVNYRSCCNSSINFRSPSKDRGILMEGKEGVDSLVGIMFRKYNFKSNSNLGVAFNEVSFYNAPSTNGEIVLAPNFGIIRYITNDRNDTFNLYKYNIR